MSVERRITKTGDPFYLVRWRAGGVPRSKSFNVAKLGGERKAERLAHAFDLKVAEDLATTGVVQLNRGARTIRTVWVHWYDDGCQDWTDETQESYASAFDKHVLPHLGALQVGAIRPTTIEQWNAKLKRAKVGPSAVQKANTALSSLLSWCVRDGLIDVNPMRAARKPPAPRKRTPVKIEPVDVERLRHWFIEQGWLGDATLVSLLAYAGLRPESEALVMQWRDWGQGVLTVQPSRKRGAKPRDIRVLRQLGDDLELWRKSVGRIGGLIVPHGRGGVSGFGDTWTGDEWDRWRGRGPVAKTKDNPGRKARGRWSRACEDLGLPSDAVPRDLRGSLATLLIWEGRSVIDCARQMGHKPSVFLDVYAGEFERFDPLKRRSAEEVIDEARAEVFGAARPNASGLRIAQ